MPKSTKSTRVTKDGSKSSARDSKPRALKSSKQGASTKQAPVEIAPAATLKRLADNEAAVRTAALEEVTEKLQTTQPIEPFELQKLWKGLWFTMWHSDKPGVQHALARDLASLATVVDAENFWPFVDAFWFIFVREWETLDQHRINKYLLLVRLMLNSILARVLSGPEDWVSHYAASMVEAGPLNYTGFRYPLSLRLHIADIYVDELEKIFETQGKPELEALKLLFEPVISQTQKSAFKPVKMRVQTEVLEDERLVEWGVIERKDESAAESSDSEWEGFD